MSEVPASVLVNLKKAAAQTELGATLLAFVQTADPRQRFIVFASDTKIRAEARDNFMVVSVAASHRHANDATNILAMIYRHESSYRPLKDIYMGHVVPVVCGYAEQVLKSKEEPEAFQAEFLFIACSSKLIWVDFTGDTDEVDIDANDTIIHICGCYHEGIRKRVAEELKALVISKAPKSGLSRVVRILKKLTGKKYIGYMTIASNS